MTKESGQASLLHYAVLALVAVTMMVSAYSVISAPEVSISIPENLAKESDFDELVTKSDLSEMLKESDLIDMAEKSDLEEILGYLDEIKETLEEIRPTPPTFTMQVIPEHIDVAVPGQACIFLVAVTGEDLEEGSVSISGRTFKDSVTVNPQAITLGQVAELTVVIPDEAIVGGNLTVTVQGEREGIKQTEKVAIGVWEFKWGIKEIEEMTDSSFKDVRDRFVTWLTTDHPELGITSETEWKGVVIKPLMPVQMFYLYVSNEWEMGITKHVMIPPDDWARIYLRRRFTEIHPTYAFEISSLDAQEEPHAIEPPESVWR